MSLVADWNKKCGNVPTSVVEDEDAYYLTLFNQLDRIKEEIKEVEEELIKRDKDPVNLLKEIADVKVTVDGLIFLSELPVQEAFELVVNDNDLKWTLDEDEVKYRFTAMGYKKDTHHLVATNWQGMTYYSIHRTSDNKICKLVKHEKLDFSTLSI